jgi:hypothetical protein
MADRKFRVILGGATSTARTIENRVVQGTFWVNAVPGSYESNNPECCLTNKDRRIRSRLANTGVQIRRVHQLVVLGSLEYGSVAYGSARKEQLQRLDPIHNQELSIAVGAFCICRTKNLLCEAGMANINRRKALKAATTAIRTAVRLEYPMKQALEDAETYDATKPNHSLSEP